MNSPLKRIRNSAIADLLRSVGDLLAAQGEDSFKVRAYERAARSVDALDKEAWEIYAADGTKGLEAIPGVGKSIAEKIEELLKTGRSRYHEELKREAPFDVSDITSVEGIGAKMARKLYDALHVRTLRELERAARAGKVRNIPGFGAKTEENILKGIAFQKQHEGRFVLGFVEDDIITFVERLRSVEGVRTIDIAGSIRRRKETIRDADVLVVALDAKRLMDAFVSQPEVVHVYAHGETKSSVKLASGIDIDVRVVPKESYGAALNYFTGSKAHNVALRKEAIKRGYKLNEYGLFSRKTGRRVGGESEEELYKKFGFAYIPPELRENQGEIEAAREGKLPNLIPYDALRGDLQTQTTWSDGAQSIEKMARAAHAAGLEYMLVTDHTKSLTVANGLDVKRLKKQWKEIDKANERFEAEGVRFKILKGTECEILRDGTLDVDDEALSQLDIVGVAVHSYFNLPRAAQTARIIRAIRNPYVDILFHPTGRLLKEREAYALDVDAVIAAAKETGTVLEVNAFPNRLDLNDEYVRRCVERGVKLAIDSDAHHTSHFGYLKYGIGQARRGWAEAKDIVNTRPLKEMLKLLKRNK